MKLIGKYAINYNTCIYRDLLEQYGLVNNEANEMLKNINNLRFGEALGQLMKNSEYTFKFLEDTVGLSKTEISYMKKNEKLNKIDVISVCLAINAPSSISKKC
ncbi:hypothetical protein QQA45_06830 [Sneathia sanguinegens]|uniref:HTH cro/C1-type domain-containing protein n=1 Tax=Sneathia sanguinegens TaxID=40543 RepID=A0ABT7HLP7_9FUSO|nr:hypothetical protein [Sneathia sanguinegens]MDK9581192.1 hypothetical protein [Sneathia sanguinegens]